MYQRIRYQSFTIFYRLLRSNEYFNNFYFEKFLKKDFFLKIFVTLLQSIESQISLGQIFSSTKFFFFPVIFIFPGDFFPRRKIFGGGKIPWNSSTRQRRIRENFHGEAIRCNNRFFLEGERKREREREGEAGWSVMEHLAGVITFRGPDTGEKSKSTTDILDARKIFPFRCFLPHFLPPTVADIQISILSGHTCALAVVDR